MFSNIASYFFGGEEEANEQQQQQNPGNPAPAASRDNQSLIITSTSSVSTSSPSRRLPPQGRKTSLTTPEEDEWVFVGGSSATPTLGSLMDTSRTPMGSTGSSITPSETGEEEEMDDDEEVESPVDEEGAVVEQAQPRGVHSRSNRRLTIPFSEPVVSLEGVKAVKSAQYSKQKKAGKALNSKKLDRQNKAVKSWISGSCRKAVAKHNLPIKQSGCNKQLKQC